MKKLKTPHGDITFPAFMPVTTFGDKYPLDRMVRPYLRRVSQCLMVSYHYAQEVNLHMTQVTGLCLPCGQTASYDAFRIRLFA